MSVELRLFRSLSDKNKFTQAVPNYQEALRHAGHNHKFYYNNNNYNKRNSANKNITGNNNKDNNDYNHNKRNNKIKNLKTSKQLNRNIVWFKSYFRKNAAAKIGRYICNLIDNYLPHNRKLLTII